MSKVKLGENDLPDSNSRAEVAEKYFCEMKFSTQVLISLWKRAALLRLTTRFSVL
jgi:hypothetical protein